MTFLEKKLTKHNIIECLEKAIDKWVIARTTGHLTFMIDFRQGGIASFKVGTQKDFDDEKEFE